MENLLSLTLVAHNGERNHHRHYALSVGRNLFNDWTVSISFGRSGQKGRVVRFSDADQAAMVAVTRERLRRRISAPKRIGCAYQLAELSTASGFDTERWLPEELRAAFLPRASE